MEARDRFALALDIDDLVLATRWADELRPWFGVAKIGLELWAAAGPDAVVSLVDRGYRVFLDVKMHDIPTTVGRAAKVLGALGPSYVTIHAAGGVDMLHAGVEGLAEGARGVGLPVPGVLGVTILTSDTDVLPETLTQRVEWSANETPEFLPRGTDASTAQSDGVQAVHRRVRPGDATPVGEVARIAQATGAGAEKVGVE